MSYLPYQFFILCLPFIINFPSIPYLASFVLSLPFIIHVPSYSLSWTLYSYPPFSTYLSFIINFSLYSLSYIIIFLSVSYLASFIFIFRFLSILYHQFSFLFLILHHPFFLSVPYLASFIFNLRSGHPLSLVIHHCPSNSTLYSPLPLPPSTFPSSPPILRLPCLPFLIL